MLVALLCGFLYRSHICSLTALPFLKSYHFGGTVVVQKIGIAGGSTLKIISDQTGVDMKVLKDAVSDQVPAPETKETSSD